MKRSWITGKARRWGAWGLATGLLWGGLWALVPPAASQADIQTIRDFEVPEFDRDNRLRYRLFGDFARILPTGAVDITGMRVDFYDPDRQVEMRVTATQCVYDRHERSARSDEHIRIARENMIITGKGFRWNADDGRFEIYEEAKVVFGDRREVTGQQAAVSEDEE